MESVVGGVVSAVKAIGRVTGHTPTRQQTNDEVVDEPTHKDWTSDRNRETVRRRWREHEAGAHGSATE